MAGLAEQDGIAVLELSFDENGLLIKMPRVDPGKMYDSFQSNDHMEVIERYIVNTRYSPRGSGKSLALVDYSNELVRK